MFHYSQIIFNFKNYIFYYLPIIKSEVGDLNFKSLGVKF